MSAKLTSVQLGILVALAVNGSILRGRRNVTMRVLRALGFADDDPSHFVRRDSRWTITVEGRDFLAAQGLPDGRPARCA